MAVDARYGRTGRGVRDLEARRSVARGLDELRRPLHDVERWIEWPALEGRVRFARFEPVDDEERPALDDGDCSAMQDASISVHGPVACADGHEPLRIPRAEVGVAVPDPEKRSALLRLIVSVDGDRRMRSGTPKPAADRRIPITTRARIDHKVMRSFGQNHREAVSVPVRSDAEVPDGPTSKSARRPANRNTTIPASAGCRSRDGSPRAWRRSAPVRSGRRAAAPFHRVVAPPYAPPGAQGASDRSGHAPGVDAVTSVDVQGAPVVCIAECRFRLILVHEQRKRASGSVERLDGRGRGPSASRVEQRGRNQQHVEQEDVVRKRLLCSAPSGSTCSSA